MLIYFLEMAQHVLLVPVIPVVTIANIVAKAKINENYKILEIIRFIKKSILTWLIYYNKLIS